ncbi:16S rRNA (adenine(1518)-N(6)/adenine(1519)-N(6))-dimethyltransferase RsmA [Helicobacter sp. 13S00477-4]|uniref:16S rRNA (adenine(1518)-N(6)/adenine(1519)-N(6))- dimethyltransferase RsmA n=1 Tax=Helicobacter sp. 13S00477-4 TaxID=1905759 RepID=UPI000BA77829|nr:16S rRNA (adenine(1518)-N(6)/adenine(1519)-N(6))-dimethyltransferase RsmA [Helicobacter sp. 13S00477-4]PAF52433.1 16S rRNA (adenine(1518)-N(6)/adenine(1519)-N(6))-dimethyltransferase [Helicobacter sp. 13S00477-4]
MEREIQHTPKKKFGQNFLKDISYINRIIQSIPNISQGEKIVEIGVGLGDLTDRLLELYKLKAYEVDKDLCSLLVQKYDPLIVAGRLELICQDVLQISYDKGWLDKKEYILVSNLPYYIASHILLKVLRDPQCKGFVVMTQKEVAQKFCAKSKEREFCALSVITHTLGQPQMLFDVPKEAFYPAPKVTSSVFMMRKNITILQDGFEEMLKVAFCSPRKKLFNNLASRYDKTFLQILFERFSIGENIRAHEVTTTTYHQIFENLKAKEYGK